MSYTQGYMSLYERDLADLYAPSIQTAPVITGSFQVNRTLSCGTGDWQGNPAITFTKQWYRNGVAIAGATGDKYHTTSVDKNAYIWCRVTATNSQGSASVDSPRVAIVTPGSGGGNVPTNALTSQYGDPLSNKAGNAYITSKVA